MPEAHIIRAIAKILRRNILEDFAEMAGIEYVRIDAKTDLYEFKNMLRWNDVYYR